MFWITEELHMCTPLQIIATFVNNQTRQMKKKITTEIIKCRKSMQEEINVLIRSY